MSEIRDKEKALYDKVWQTPGYGRYSPGETYVEKFRSWAFPDGVPDGATLIDFGCGSGRASRHLSRAGFNVALMDFALPHCLDEQVQNYFNVVPAQMFQDSLYDSTFFESNWGQGVFDYGFCCDVMEHIPYEKVDQVLENIAKCVTKLTFFSISCVPDAFGKKVGEPLHKTVQPFSWWKAAMMRYFEVKDCQGKDGSDSVFFLVAPKKNKKKKAAEDETTESDGQA